MTKLLFVFQDLKICTSFFDVQIFYLCFVRGLSTFRFHPLLFTSTFLGKKPCVPDCAGLCNLHLKNSYLRPRTAKGSVVATQSVTFGLDFVLACSWNYKTETHNKKWIFHMTISHLCRRHITSSAIICEAPNSLCMTYAIWCTVPRCKSWHNGTTGVSVTSQPKA